MDKLVVMLSKIGNRSKFNEIKYGSGFIVYMDIDIIKFNIRSNVEML